MRRWAAAAFGSVVVVMALSGAEPWRYTFGGLFRPPDFAQDLAAARVFAADQNPYEVGIARTHAELMEVPPDEGYPHFPHPPLLFLLVLPLADLTLPGAALLWFAVSLGLLFLLAAVIAETCFPRPGADAFGTGIRDSGSGIRGPRSAVVLAIYLSLVVWPPVLYNLAKGQWSILIAFLLALCWRFCVRGHHGQAGAIIGLASGVKLFPALLGLYLLTRAPRAVVPMALAVGAVFLAPLVWLGSDALGMFLVQSKANLAYWETFPAVTFSLHGILARSMVGGQWARPLVEAPAAAAVLGAIASIALVALVTGATWRHHPDDGREGARFSAWIALIVVLNPLAMAHTGVLLALPIVLTARGLHADPRTWPKLAWTAGVLLVSIPGHTLFALAPTPIEPWQGVTVIGLPFWGTLLLLAAALAVCRAGSPVAETFEERRGRPLGEPATVPART